MEDDKPNKNCKDSDSGPSNGVLLAGRFWPIIFTPGFLSSPQIEIMFDPPANYWNYSRILLVKMRLSYFLTREINFSEYSISKNGK